MYTNKKFLKKAGNYLYLTVGGIERFLYTYVYLHLMDTYVSRVGSITDAEIIDEVGTDLLLGSLAEISDQADWELIFKSDAGVMIREDGVLKYYRWAYDASGNSNDLNGSATASLQPRLVGGLAPNSKPAASNQNGEARYFTHPDILFEATDQWSFSIVFNWNGSQEDARTAFAGQRGTSTNSLVITAKNTSNNILILKNFTNDDSPSIGTPTNLSAKNNILTFVITGDGYIQAYLNGNALSRVLHTTGTKFLFRNIFSAYSTAQRDFDGNISCVHLQSGAMSAAQVLAEYNLLRSMYPEIETATIGTQTWASRNFEAVATPMGNVIANVTENEAVEKIVNGGFDTDTDWIKGVGWSISEGKGVVIYGLHGQSLYQPNKITSGKWYKITFTISDYVAGGIVIKTGNNQSQVYSSNGTFAIYLLANNSGFYITSYGATITLKVDNVSIQELNWSNATEIYDAVYAATAGTAAQKEYAALKEAAMWCYYNNSADNGAIYGKLYNYYAAKLLDLDMQTAGFGWRVTQDADWDELGIDETDNSLKVAGDTYWETGNQGNNSTSLTLLGAGIRDVNGEFINNTEVAAFWNSDGTVLYKTIGANIRLIKNI